MQEFGIAAADIKKLKDNGIHSVEALAHSNKRDLVNMKGLSEAKIDKMQKECNHLSGCHCLPITVVTLCYALQLSSWSIWVSQLPPPSWSKERTTSDFQLAAKSSMQSLKVLACNLRCQWHWHHRASTGHGSAGGVETGSITEVYGEFRCGKTQLCHTLCVKCQVCISVRCCFTFVATFFPS